MVKKIILSVVILVMALAALAASLLYKYPYVPTMVAEGFPQGQWPTKGVYVQLTGRPITLPHKLSVGSVPKSPAGKQLWSLLQDRETDALLAYHKGVLKYAYIRPGLSPDTQFNSYSMAKSLIGYLVLKAIEEGEIDGLDSPIGNYLLDLTDKNLSAVPIKKFLTMSSGLEFEFERTSGAINKNTQPIANKSYSDPFSHISHLHIEGIQGISDLLKLPKNPHYDFHYQNVNSALLGAMLVAIYKKPLNEILSEKIWKPAGASHAKWRTYPDDGQITAYCCLFARAHDWGKIGNFLSMNGTKNSPFLSNERRDLMSTKPYTKEQLHKGVYGLHVRHDTLDREGEPLQGPFTYFAGHGGQLVYLKPENELVVVRFGQQNTLLHSTLYLVWREIMAREETSEKTRENISENTNEETAKTPQEAN